MKKVRFGIAGFGRFAELTIAPAIRLAHNAEIVAIQKRSLNDAREKAKQFDIPFAFDSVQALAACPEVDAVFVVSANASHAPDTITAARHGKHVLCEKPMAMNAGEASAMIAACDQHGVKLMIGHMVRLSPAVVRLKELMRRRAVGDVIHIKSEFTYDSRLSHRRWLVDRSVAGGGAVFDIGVHCYDTMRFLLDDQAVSVRSTLQPIPDEQRTESTAAIALQFSKGTTGSIFCSLRAPLRRSVMEVMGTEGVLTLENFTRSSTTVRLRIDICRNDEVMQSSGEQIVVPNLYAREVELLADCILNGTTPVVTGEDGLTNQRMIDAVLVGGW